MNAGGRKALVLAAAIAVAGGGYWLVQRRAEPAGIEIAPAPTPLALAPTATPTVAPLVVHVAGAVRAPGVYALPAGARVIDAVEAAGGLDDEADADQLNLADHLQDAMRLYIPQRGEPAPAAPTPIAVRSGGLDLQVGGGLVNINTATQAELETLPHIGPALAGRIIAHRQAQGPFGRIEDLKQVSGIGDKTFADLQNLITVD
ncbi:MAG: helix-hairpin-helix domain-containing protein [Anaerolineae bacterium]